MLPSIAASSSGHWNHDGVAQMAARDRSVRREPHMGEDVAAERLDQREALDRRARRRQRGADRPVRQARKHRLDQIEALADLLDPHPDARVDVARRVGSGP